MLVHVVFIDELMIEYIRKYCKELCGESAGLAWNSEVEICKSKCCEAFWLERLF